MKPPPELVDLAACDARLVIGLRYATAENFTGRVIYPADAPALLRPATAAKLRAAQDNLAPRGLRLKILDAYRPPSAQRALWAARPDERFVAPPARGSRHTRGTAVDATLADAAGCELAMPSAFDEFSERAARDFPGGPAGARLNRDLLRAAMEDAGFTTIASEWWHFDDADGRAFPLLEFEW